MNGDPGRSKEDAKLERRQNFPWFLQVPTRWIDNDSYGHLNNAFYYTLFETALMHYWRIERGFDLDLGAHRTFSVESSCRFLAPLGWPGNVDCGLRVAHVGRSSIRYELGIFGEGDENPSALGYVVDVIVDGTSHRPTPIPDGMRAGLRALRGNGNQEA